MAEYKGKTVTVPYDAQTLVDKFADLTRLSAVKDQLPADVQQQAADISFEPQAIVINTKQLGDIRFVLTDRTTSKIRFAAQGTPIPLNIEADLTDRGDQTDIDTGINVDIPMMLKPLVGPQMQKMADMLSDLIAKVASV